MKIKNPEDFDKKVLNEIDSKISDLSQMSKLERYFLNGIIRQVRPKKIVEIGIAAGSSSAVILNAIKDIKGAKLYSLDYFKNHYRIEGKLSGFIVDEFPELKKKWKLYTGGVACNFLEEIGGGIDVCVLDTVHNNPGEFLDYLQVLPYMKKNGIIIIHDTALHTLRPIPIDTTCCVLLSAISGEKIIPEYKCTFFPNIGAVLLDKNAKERAFDVFNCLSLPWCYMPKITDIVQLHGHFLKHYGTKLADDFVKAVRVNERVLNIENSDLNKQIHQIKPIDFIEHFTKLTAQKQIDKLAKKYRNKKIIIYGAGQYCRTLFDNYDLSKLNIVAVADKSFELEENKSFYGLSCITPNDLKEFNCDIILLGVFDTILISNYLKNEILIDCKNSKRKIQSLIKKYSSSKNYINTIQKLQKTLTQFLQKSTYKKSYCPYCNKKSVFLPYGIFPRDNALCPLCSSLERHRFLYYVYKDLFLNSEKQIKVLHMAPEKCIYELINDINNIDYTAIDLNPEQFVDIKNIQKCDVTKMHFKDNYFDIILSNHIIEHVEDESKFLLELKRVLKNDGKIILTVPYSAKRENTLEDSNVKTKEERLKAYWHEDHVRLYGKDIIQRLGKYFEVKQIIEKDSKILNDCFILTKE